MTSAFSETSSASATPPSTRRSRRFATGYGTFRTTASHYSVAALGWTPGVRLADGLERTIEWIRAELYGSEGETERTGHCAREHERIRYGRDSHAAVVWERTVNMKRFGYALLGALPMTLLTAMPALAQSVVGPPQEDDVGPQVIGRAPGGDVVQAPGGVAFTGSEITLWMVVAAVLLAGGVTLYVLGRRRARAVAN
jgi:hypothetical protein